MSVTCTYLSIVNIVLDNFVLIQPAAVPIVERLRQVPVVQCLVQILSMRRMGVA